GGAEKLTFSPDGRLLAACTRDGGTLHVWRIDSVAQQQSIVKEPPAGVVSLAFSSDGRNLITGTKLGSVKTWPLEDRGAAPPGRFRRTVARSSTSQLPRAAVFCLSSMSCTRLISGTSPSDRAAGWPVRGL